MTSVHLRKSLCAYLYSKSIALVVSTGVWNFSLWRFFKWVNFPGRDGEQVSSCVSPHVGVGTEMPPVQLCSWSSLCGDLQIPPTKGSSCVERKTPIEQRWVSKPLTIKKLQEVSAKAIDRYHGRGGKEEPRRWLVEKPTQNSVRGRNQVLTGGCWLTLDYFMCVHRLWRPGNTDH